VRPQAVGCGFFIAGAVHALGQFNAADGYLVDCLPGAGVFVGNRSRPLNQLGRRLRKGQSDGDLFTFKSLLAGLAQYGVGVDTQTLAGFGDA